MREFKYLYQWRFCSSAITVYLSEYYKSFFSLGLHNYTLAMKFCPNSDLHQSSSPGSHFTPGPGNQYKSLLWLHKISRCRRNNNKKITHPQMIFFVCLWYCKELLILWVSVPYSCPNNLGTHYMKTGPCPRFPALQLDFITDPTHCRGWYFPSSTDLDVAE